jgi:hypothetical protein
LKRLGGRYVLAVEIGGRLLQEWLEVGRCIGVRDRRTEKKR